MVLSLMVLLMPLHFNAEVGHEQNRFRQTHLTPPIARVMLKSDNVLTVMNQSIFSDET